ncbi:MAG TPA: prepilin-type N-terminal cleavage/methylation domain-containing protein, partial [Gemmatimonadaceae bacterium]|nr:prepilin-type N-terminal cleavage/methylation domain-containing protein [Gemmatimonadaceae bacterium]
GEPMNQRRRGFTLVEVVLVILLLAALVGVGILWQRVQKLNTWAVKTDAWLVNDLYPWVKNNSFQTGPGGGNPDGTKPPPPPDGL